jgi:predicted dithiol-disulfide oxidoreductase (DUF899 family)
MASKASRTRAMTKHRTGTREEWLAARLELLDEEKELTRRSDGLARRRQELPWVRIDKQYRFETEDGSASLADLFRGRSQLLVYHVGAVHHTYSTYARGVEALMGTYQLLDFAPWGRNEDVLEFPQAWWRRHNEYDKR